MAHSLTGKVLLLTGGGGGIGRAIALRMAQEGMKIILLGGSNLKKLEETKALVEAYSPCAALPGDLTDMAFLENAAAQAAEIFGGIDVLINNAGAAANHAFENVTAAEFDKIMAINVKVPFFLTQSALPFLKKSGIPTVINIASVTGHDGYPQQSVYSASKHALLGMTKSIASEYYR
jgi:NAD(P)-dependent dehydrogenase (short-subunit alcohol dehydrogenase family)